MKYNYFKQNYIMILVICLLLFIGCAQPPVMQEGELYPCFKARDCHFRNPDHPELCIDEDKECRARERYIFCKDPLNRWKDCKEQECWDKLNSK